MNLIVQTSRALLLPFLAATFLCSSPAPAQSVATPADQGELIQQLQKKIEELEAAQKLLQEKVNNLSPAGAQAPAAAPPQEPVSQAAQEATPATEAETPAAHVLGPVQFHGFSDFDYGRAWFEKLPPTGLKGSSNSFNIGDFDLYTTTQLSDNWSMLGEMLISSDFSNEFSVEMDRLLLTYTKNDYFKISFGKFATALGYYTSQFHRAQYFQTAVGRPIMYSDEDNGSILPTHSIGVSATGLLPSGPLGLHWVAQVSNGRSSTIPDVPVQNFVDEGNGKAVDVALYARPDRIAGLQTGVAVYHDILHPSGLPQTNETIVTVHVVYVGSRLEWLNEAAMVRHSN